MSATLAARRYAKALLRLARQQQTLVAVRADVNALQALLESAPDFHRFVTESIGLDEERINVIRTLFSGNVQDATLKSLLYMESSHRMPLLPGMIVAFQRMHDELQNIRHLDIVSAIALSDTQKQVLEDKFAKKLGGSVMATHRINPKLLAGFRVRAGDTIFDATVDTQLRQLRRAMMSA